MAINRVRKAIFPVAGYGTRFLPATKAQPKEMLTLVDKPVVQYLVEEAVEAGIETIIFVINSNKHIIGDHFSRNLELEKMLRAKKKKALLESIRHIHKEAEFIFVHQDEPLGSGDAVMRGRGLVGDEPFALFYADDVMDSPKGKPAIGQLIETFERYHESVMGLIDIPRSQSRFYGMISGKKIGDRTYQIHGVVEKPDPKDTPSTLASVGRFIITPDIFQYIPKLKKKNGEIYFADALDAVAKQGKLYGYEMDAVWHDCGNKLGFFKATVEFGMKHREIGDEARAFLKRI
ncbi:MAG: UTP--glucose-1-phosphate uridylyltransferase [Candidatus Spechtbacteria bacterium]|nr:UTP--glucose-1-phosphate uridylyltransferase [Candidatus Spechtbacteria bacterium]